MGGTSSTSQTSSQSLAPYEPTAGSLNGILGQLGNAAGGAGSLNSGQSGALDRIISNSNGTPNFQPQINAGNYGLLNGGGANNNNGGISQNLANYNANIGGTASGANIGQNPALKAQLDQIASDTTNQVNGQFAASGRDGSPGNAMALGRGIAAGEAPVIAQQYNTDVANQQAAAGNLYNAGNSTYGMLNSNQAQANQNFQNGVGTIGAGVAANNAAPSAALTAASAQWGIPVQQLQTLLGSIAPVSAQFGTQSGTAQGTQQASGAQQFAQIGQGALGIGRLLFG